MLEAQVKSIVNAYSGIFRIYFFRSPNGGTMVDRLLAKGIKDYQRFFKFDSNVTHVAVQIEDTVYETTLRGTVCYPFTEEFLDNPRLLAHWEYDLKLAGVSDKVPVIQQVFERQIDNSRILDVKGSIKYAWDFFWTQTLVGYDSWQEDDTIGESTCFSDDYTLRFSLPFTCVTLANLALDVLFEMVNTPDSHLPAPLYLCCLTMNEYGIGELVNYGLSRLYFV